MLVKHTQRSPCFLTWCPVEGKGHLLAAGNFSFFFHYHTQSKVYYFLLATREGTLDENFQSKNYLEILDTKFSNDCNPNIKSVTKVDSTEAFTSIAWGQTVVTFFLGETTL